MVAIAIPPCIEYAIAFAAILRTGAIATGLNTRLGPREVAAIADATHPKLVIVPDGAPVIGLPPGIPTMDTAMVSDAASGPRRPAPATRDTAATRR